MAKLIRQQDLNIIPHPPMTVFYRHEWDENGKTRVLNSRTPEIYDGGYIAVKMGSPNNRFKRLIMNMDSLYRIGYCCTTTYCDYLELNAPNVTTLQLPYVMPRLYSKNVVLNFNSAKLTSLNYVCAANPYGDCAMETCQITGAARASAAQFAFGNCYRLYSVRIDSLANCGSMSSFGLTAILDKATILHLRDVLLASTKTGTLAIGIASELQTDEEVQAALDEIRTKRSVTVRYNTVPYDLRQKVYGRE